MSINIEYAWFDPELHRGGLLVEMLIATVMRTADGLGHDFGGRVWRWRVKKDNQPMNAAVELLFRAAITRTWETKTYRRDLLVAEPVST